jgi:hypothetical protein
MSQIETLYELLPAIYRLRDFDRGEPLRALLAVIQAEYEAVRQDIAGLYDDWFVETCADWVIPYIGDLVGNRPLHEIQQLRRTDVAKTIYYRRRKGTLAMLEEMARDVTGWGAHAVEFFQHLGWTQNLNHIRRTVAANPDGRNPNAVDRVGTVNLRSRDVVDRIGGAFDVTSHTVDVRPISQQTGWHNIRNIGFFLWRLRHYPVQMARARRSLTDNHGFHLSPLGNPAPLFNNPQREADDTGLASEIHVPEAIRTNAFYEDTAEYERLYGGLPPNERPANSDYYGSDGRALFLVLNGNNVVPPSAIMCKDLSNWAQPPVNKVAVDVDRGRITFPPGQIPNRVDAVYTYGFSADIGGGPYDRRGTLATNTPDVLFLEVAQSGAPFTTIQLALNAWVAAGRPTAVIEIGDSQTYGGSWTIQVPAGRTLTIQAANERRPHLRLNGTTRLRAMGNGAAVILNGLLMEAEVSLRGPLDFTMRHSTLVPGRNLDEEGAPRHPSSISIFTQGSAVDMRVTIEASIVGPIRLPDAADALTFTDSIIHAVEGGLAQPAISGATAGSFAPVTTIERSTIWGLTRVRELALASDSIFNDAVVAERRQMGCVRFSYLAPGSATPRRFRCQPDLALSERAEELGLDNVADLPLPERSRIIRRQRPEYTSEHYGDPGYAQLSLAAADGVRQGAESGAEMGAFEKLKQPQRLANLQLRLEEYLPFGLRAGSIFVN